MRLAPIFFVMALLFSLGASEPSMQNVPVAYKGRFRPMESYARLWLSDTYQNEQIKRKDRQAFHSLDGSAQDLLWKMHFLGHAPWDDAPFFSVHNLSLVNLLGLDSSQEHFSYNQLFQSIYVNKESNLRLTQLLLTYFFLKEINDPSNRSHSERLELNSLAPGLWVAFQSDDIVAVSGSDLPLWNQIAPGMLLMAKGRHSAKTFIQENKTLADDSINILSALTQYAQVGDKKENGFNSSLRELKAKGMPPREIALALDAQYPLQDRLMHADLLLKALPGFRGEGEWLPLKALKTKVYNPSSQKLEYVDNFTLYSDEQFEAIRQAYLKLENAVLQSHEIQAQEFSRQLATLLNQAYESLAGTPYIESTEKTISYPSTGQLKAEVFYYKYPTIALIIIAYSFAAGMFILASGIPKRFITIFGWVFLLVAFSLHTFLLALRCYILSRPPVSNMFETVIYVPWIAVLVSFFLYWKLKNNLVFVASSIVALLLLTVLQVTNISSGLENVQAVLDSQYWLIIHVLLVVGSYGVFALSGILGHLYLILNAVYQHETATMQFISKCMVQAIYLGVAMLIPGTILGGVWAAESWGRFWDWDPKESWAFISICIYLIWIHAYTFHHIRNFGLAVGAVFGFIAISFTWYGVNYVLGTGLHSYGFGSGGEGYYYLYLLGECSFLGIVSIRQIVIGKVI